MNISVRLKSFARSKEAIILLLLLIIGASVRIYGAWCLRHNLNLDAGVVALMAKHISEGSAFPVFFYGQAYMGSLEAYVSAFFMKVFGLYGFGVTLGTALVSFLLLPVVYVWARDIGGPTAGYAALAFCIIGPLGGFYHYAVSPRGGYAACLLFGTMAMWLSTRIAQKTLKQGEMPVLSLFMLGVVAGLGWWTNQLVIAALLASTFMMVMVLRRLFFSPRLFWGIAGFFLGSLPFWFYNILNDWATFAFAESLRQVGFFEGLKQFFIDRMPVVVGLSKAPPVYLIMTALIYLAALAICAWLAIKALRRGNVTVWASMLSLFLFVFFSSLVFSTSHFAAFDTPRYLLPLVPALAIFLGVALSYLATIIQSVPAWIPLIILVAPQYQALVWATNEARANSLQQAHIEMVGAYMESQDISGIYANKVHRSWNFALREQIVFSELWEDFYKPNAQYNELALSPAVLGDHNSATGFLETTSGSASERSVVGAQIHYNFVPPVSRIEEIPVDMWRSVHDSTGQEIMETITSPVYPVSWFSPRRPHEDWLEITFNAPVRISAIRLLSHDFKTYPRFLQVEALQVGSDGWTVLHEASFPGLYFWSGSRFYPFGNHYRLENFFQPTLVEKMRIVNKADIALRRDFRWGVQFLQVFGPGPEQPSEEEFLPDLVELLRKRGIVFLYSDRWLANAVYQATNGQVWTPLETSLFPEGVHPLYRRAKQQFLLPIDPDQVMFFDARTALLTRWEDVPLARRSLDHAGLHMRETVIGPWVLFDFPEGAFPADDVRVVGLRWTGFGCIPTQFQAIRRQVLPELAGDVAFFYPDNNWTTGNLVLTGLNYKTSPQDRYLRLSLKAPHPHGHDASSLGIMVWLNRTRLALAYEEGLDFYFWMGLGFNEINSMRIQSRTFVPERLGIGNDTRMLGLMVESIELTNSLPEKNLDQMTSFWN